MVTDGDRAVLGLASKPRRPPECGGLRLAHRPVPLLFRLSPSPGWSPSPGSAGLYPTYRRVPKLVPADQERVPRERLHVGGTAVRVVAGFECFGGHATSP